MATLLSRSLRAFFVLALALAFVLPPLAIAAPAAPTLALDAASDTGDSSSDGLTNLPTPTFIGTADPNAAITLYDGASSLGTATADATTGAWSITSSSLSDGSHSIHATAELDGETSDSAPITVTVDSVVPSMPSLQLHPSIHVTDGVTTSSSLTFNVSEWSGGPNELNSTAKIYDNGILVGTGTLVAGGTGDYVWAFNGVFANGDHVFSATVTDKAGNVSPAQVLFSITVADPAAVTNSAPVATDGAASVNDNATASIALAATDADSDPLTYSIVDAPAHGSLDTSALNSTHTVVYTPEANYDGSDSFTWKANDGTADSNVATQTMTVHDVTFPNVHQVTAVTDPTNDSTPNWTFYTDEAGTITWGGGCSSLTTDADLGDNTVSFEALPDGTYSTCSALVTDAHGNHAASGLHITAFTIDTVAPVLTLLGSPDITIDVGSTYTDAGATSLDARDGSDTPAVDVSGSVHADTVGTYTLTYDAQDRAGNQAAPVTRTVHVVDTVPPTLSLNGDASIDVAYGGVFTDPGVTVSDNYDTAEDIDVTISGSVDTAVSSVQLLTYTATDSSGNASASVTRAVRVGTSGSSGGSSSSSGGSSGGSVIGFHGSSIATTTTAVDNGSVLGAATYNFSTDLDIGSTGPDVTELQNVLIAAGYLTVPASGWYGPMTATAVKLYQSAHGITPVSGHVGPLTRAALNTGTTPTMSDEQRSLLLAQLEALLAQLKVLQARLLEFLSMR